MSAQSHDEMVDAIVMEYEQYLHGECHLLAIALHQRTGLPLGAYLDTDLESGNVFLLHAFVMDGEHIIDLKGRRSHENMLEDFDSFDPDLCRMGVDEVLKLGQGRIRVPAARLREANPAVDRVMALLKCQHALDSTAPRPKV